MFVKADTTDGQGRQGHLRGQEHRAGPCTGSAIVAAPAKAPGGMLDESTCWPRARSSTPGASETVTAQLKPGSYELVCFLAGHYAAGQKLAFQVK